LKNKLKGIKLGIHNTINSWRSSKPNDPSNSGHFDHANVMAVLCCTELPPASHARRRRR